MHMKKNSSSNRRERERAPADSGRHRERGDYGSRGDNQGYRDRGDRGER
mgnify:FL=1